MGKLRCKCGNILSNVASPNEVEGYLIKDQDLEFEGLRDSSDIMDIGRLVWECNECGRLAVSYPGKDDATVKWYVPEDGIPGGLMRFDE